LAIGTQRYYSNDKVPSDDSKEEVKEETKADASPESELPAKLQAKEQEVVDLTGRLRYLQADFLNLQRNAAREKEQQRDFAITRFASDLLETVDVLTLALRSIPPTALQPTPAGDSSSTTSSPPVGETATDSSTPPKSKKSAQAYLNELHEGVEMTQRLLLQTLFKYHVKPFDPTGDIFDPNRHEALYQVPVSGIQPGSVIDCQKLGYTIKDRILRAAQVGVAQEEQS
jgi:molecular chaperone GrpE